MQILEAASKLQEAGWVYAMEASFIEVYNETLRDLLAESRNPRDAGKVLDQNAIKHAADGAQGHVTVRLLCTPGCCATGCRVVFACTGACCGTGCKVCLHVLVPLLVVGCWLFPYSIGQVWQVRFCR